MSKIVTRKIFIINKKNHTKSDSGEFVEIYASAWNN